MSNTDWYSDESWYAPLKGKEAEQGAKKKKKKRTGLRITGAVLLLLALIVGSCMAFRGNAAVPPYAIADGEFPEDTLPKDKDSFFDGLYTNTTGKSAVINIEKTVYTGAFPIELQKAGTELSLQELYRKCSQYVVAISGYTDGKMGYSWGTGLIASADGLIITNTHIIDGCDRATVTLNDDTVYEAMLIGADSISDIALLKIEAEGLPAAQFGESDAMTVGDRVAAIGNPLGEDFRLTFTDGIVSGIERGLSYNGHNMNLLQTNTALNEGNSGGPLFNMSGQVVGITNMKMMSSYSSIEGIGFAIPSSTVKSMAQELIANGAVLGRPALGITVGNIPDEAREAYGLPVGIYVTEVQDGSDAKTQGILVGDIITAVNGLPVETKDDVANEKEKFSVGDSMTLTIWRDGETMDVTIRLVDSNELK